LGHDKGTAETVEQVSRAGTKTGGFWCEVSIFAFTHTLSLDFVTKNTGFKPAYDDSALWLIDILLQCNKMNVCLLIEG
jgi:hypothetical protein